MSTDNERLIRRFFEEVVNQGNLGLIEAIYASNVVDRNTLRKHAHGQTSIRNTLLELRMLFPDLYVTVVELKVEAGTVVTRELWQGSHIVTGRQAEGMVTHIFRIHNDQIVEEWSGGWEWLD